MAQFNKTCSCDKWIWECPGHLETERERLRLRAQEAQQACAALERQVELMKHLNWPDEELMPTGPLPSGWTEVTC